MSVAASSRVFFSALLLLDVSAGAPLRIHSGLLWLGAHGM